MANIHQQTVGDYSPDHRGTIIYSLTFKLQLEQDVQREGEWSLNTFVEKHERFHFALVAIEFVCVNL